MIYFETFLCSCCLKNCNLNPLLRLSKAYRTLPVTMSSLHLHTCKTNLYVLQERKNKSVNKNVQL